MNLLFVLKFRASYKKIYEKRRSILEGLKQYPNSTTQKTYHDYILNQNYEKKIKQIKLKSGTDYLLRYSSKNMRIRQFLFGQPFGNIGVFPEANRYQPDGIWGYTQQQAVLDKQFGYDSFPDLQQMIATSVEKKEKEYREKLTRYFKAAGINKSRFNIIEQLKIIMRLPEGQYRKVLSMMKSQSKQTKS